MPAEPSQSKLKRRSSRKEVEESLRFDGGHAREIELKRNRGEISCAECRRLKIKCDKQIPCQSCQRRGCAALCPNGSLATGQGTRFVLAATEHLHRRVSRMRERIRLLEDALASLQAKQSNETHPLLRDDLLSANVEGEDDEAGGDEGPVPNNPPEIIDTFGTLSISDHGISRFFGPTGGSESLLMADNSSTHDSPAGSHTPESIRDSKSPSLPGELTLFSQSFPFTPMGPAVAVQQLIEGHLPSWERACSLSEIYLSQAGWLFRGVSRIQLLDEMLPVIYKREVVHPPEDYSGPHDLALLYIIFAVGALVDLNQEPSNPEAEHYHQIARASLCLQPVLEKPSLVTIQTLHLLSVYNAMNGNEVNGNETSMETTWSLVTLAAHLSQTVGLHRDSARWRLSPKMVQRRRILFWDLFVADAWQSLNTGRPPSFSLAYIDCQFPQLDKDGVEIDEKEPRFESWGFRFASECVAEVASRTLTAETPSYAVIMELDRKVREFPIPDEAAALTGSIAGRLPEDTPSLSASMQFCVLSHAREVVLLYIHRSFFAQAVIEYPANPLRSPYAPSFLAAYRSSTTILKSIRDQFAIHPALCARFWSMWTYAFSAAVVFGTVVTRGPRSPLASAAMTELDHACLLFSKASVHSRRAAKAMPILTKLSEKARYALAASNNAEPPGPGLNGSLWNVKAEDDDELAIFAGRTRFVSSAKQYAPTPKYPPAEPPSNRPTTPPYIPVSQPKQYQVPSSSSSSSSFRPEQTQPTPRIVSPWIPDHHGQEYLPAHESQAPQSHYPAPCYQQPERPAAAGPSNYAWNHESGTNQHYHGHVPAPHYNIPPAQNSAPPGPYQDASHHHLYTTSPAFRPNLTQPPPSELTDLGLASRDSRLDERWTSFMQDTGILEDVHYRPR